jgi:hypothetical protein
MAVARFPTSFLFVFLALSATITAQETLTNEIVINMTKANISDRDIVDMIQKDPGNYVVTSSTLIALKQQGVLHQVDRVEPRV